MKHIIIYSVLLAMSMAAFTACSSSQGMSSKQTQQDYSTFNSLADILRLKGGLQVMGTGNNVKVLIRGTSTIKLNTQPLYVIDGNPIGHDYSMANSAVNPADIESVRVLKGKSETAKYGGTGTNGVIIIKTRRTAD